MTPDSIVKLLEEHEFWEASEYDPESYYSSYDCGCCCGSKGVDTASEWRTHVAGLIALACVY